MAHYYWKGIDLDGRTRSGHIQATYKRGARAQLLNQHITPIDLCLIRCNPKDWVLECTQQLALLTNAHIQIHQALCILAVAQQAAPQRNCIEQMIRDMETGMRLSDAMGAFPYFFNQEYCALIRAGESCGALAEIFTQLAQWCLIQQRSRDQIKKTLAYPIFLFLCIVCISVAMMWWVVPKYQIFYQELGGHLPKLTQYVINVSEFLKTQCVFLIFLLIFFIPFSFFLFKKIKNYAFYIDQFFLNLPYLKTWIIQANLSSWSYLLSIFLKNNMPLTTSIHMSNELIKNRYLKFLFDQIPKDLENGCSLKTSFQKLNHVLNESMIQMIVVGENACSLSTIFQALSEQFENNKSKLFDKFLRILEPFVLLCLSGIVCVLILALYLPVLNLGNI